MLLMLKKHLLCGYERTRLRFQAFCSTWTAEIRDFQDRLDDSQAGSLSSHEFLKKSPGPACLIPHARIAVKTKIPMLRKRSASLKLEGGVGSGWPQIS
jgi:hypothetical protein